MDMSELDAMREMAMGDAFGTRLKVQSTDSNLGHHRGAPLSFCLLSLIFGLSRRGESNTDSLIRVSHDICTLLAPQKKMYVLKKIRGTYPCSSLSDFGKSLLFILLPATLVLLPDISLTLHPCHIAKGMSIFLFIPGFTTKEGDCAIDATDYPSSSLVL